MAASLGAALALPITAARGLLKRTTGNKKGPAEKAGPGRTTTQTGLEMPNVILQETPLDARISNLPPEREPQPAPPLRLTLAPESDDDAQDLADMRARLRGYIREHGADVVLRAVQALSGRGDGTLR